MATAPTVASTSSSTARGHNWVASSGAGAIKAASPLSYSALAVAALQAPHGPTVVQVRKDLPRTFPLHPRFAVAVGGDPGQDGGDHVVAAGPDSLIPALERVLLAVATWQPQTGYTQGMNFVAATLLLQLDEEDAFWVMTAVVGRLYPHFYDGDLSGTQIENSVIGELLAGAVPELHRRLEAAGIPHELFTT